ncbi:MAG: hypothetical protein K1X67_18905 [Fimbriimonadaceae bacterium]|nr:hypothetical protein [Fimbriimonadaceae bacterium]
MAKDAWTSASRFSDTRARNEAVSALLAGLFEERTASNSSPAPRLSDEARSVVNDLLGSLANEPPVASQAAEAALTLAAFTLAEDRVLNLDSSSSKDLTESGRIAGDRGVGDRLCAQVLEPRNIPATRGPFQSSSFRAGYLAPQVRNASLRRFVAWQSHPDRSLGEVRAMAEALVDGFLSKAASMPPFPALVASRFSFTAYRQAREKLLAVGSAGALEQYLLAGLLNEELSASLSGLRVTTKNVGANDRSSGAAGDLEIRHRHALEGAIEVTAASWEDKLDQLPAVAEARLSEAVIAAPNVTNMLSGKELAEKVDPIATRLGLDVAVLDLHALMDVSASRITKAARAEAFRFVYRCLAQYHRRQPELAERLVSSLVDLDLASRDGALEVNRPEDLEVDIVFVKVRDFLAAEDIADIPETPTALRDLATWLETEVGAGDEG